MYGTVGQPQNEQQPPQHFPTPQTPEDLIRFIKFVYRQQMFYYFFDKMLRGIIPTNILMASIDEILRPISQLIDNHQQVQTFYGDIRVQQMIIGLRTLYNYLEAIATYERMGLTPQVQQGKAMAGEYFLSIAVLFI